MKMTKEIEEFINLTITEHMGKSYADWKLSQSSVTEPDEVEEAVQKVIATLSAGAGRSHIKILQTRYLTAERDRGIFLLVGIKRRIAFKNCGKESNSIIIVIK